MAVKTYVVQSAPHGHVALSVDDDCASVTEHGVQVRIDLATLREWGLARLLDVTSHHVNQVGTTVSHVVRFVNGGHVAMAWHADGRLIEMTAEGVEIKVDATGRMLLGPMPSGLQAQLPTMPGREG
jgi:hypothetical protein